MCGLVPFDVPHNLPFVVVGRTLQALLYENICLSSQIQSVEVSEDIARISARRVRRRAGRRSRNMHGPKRRVNTNPIDIIKQALDQIKPLS